MEVSLKDEGLSPSAALILATVAFGAAAQGGFYRSAMVVLVALALAAGVVGMRSASLRLADLEVALVALGAWAIVAGAVGGSVVRAISTAAVCLAVAGVGISLRAVPTSERTMISSGIAAIGALVAITGVAGIAIHLEPFAIPSQGLWRAATTLTYANAAGCLLAMTTLCAVALVIDRPGPRSAVVAAVNLAGLGATMSRGAVAAFVVGVGVFIAVDRGPRVLGATVPAAAGALLILGGLAPSFLESGPARPLPAVAGVALGLAAAVLLTRMRALLAAVLLAVVFVAGLAGLAGSAVGDRLVDKRFNAGSPVRIEEARAALRVVQARPLTGAGPGRAPLVWKDPSSDSLLVAEFAHNEYLQMLADTGIVGGVLVLVVIVLVVGRIVGGREHAPTPALRAAVAGGLAAFLVQSAVDFMWHVPVLPVLAATLAGMCVGFDRSRRMEDDR